MTDSLYLPAARLRPAAITLPGSKSISNRTLLLAALSDNACRIENLLDADDTRHMLAALQSLGVRIEHHGGGSYTVHGCGGRFPRRQADLFLGNAGTAFRPLTAALALLGGDYRLHGVARMHERPIGDLVDALHQAGADIRYEGRKGYPPLHIGERQAGGQSHIAVRGNVSSQFLTALLMALPLTGQAHEIEVQGELISKPYIDITLKLMAQFGVQVAHDSHRLFRLPETARYHAPATLHVEGDASGASYFLAAGLLAAAPVRVNGIGRHSIQGDTAFAAELEKIGAAVEWGENYIQVARRPSQRIRPFDLDANHIPDAAMTLAVVALASGARCSLRNIGSWRVKETDRIAAMAAELRKLGARVEEEAEAIHITPPPRLAANARIDTYDDHRMAMCFSLVSLLGVPVYINDPQCVNKTFPDYFRLFESMRA
ncbi:MULTISPECIES: 3-phosphoshikimate 1-carboxyvinyltransferase [unclassified Eikenella]|uniref:3-phosphoshikimate 1-carboxyvinyltransferase n=1 Tax=unclassified Eikenella TaxID=2639367 RepID=UPI0008A24051|nr:MULTISPECIES: 3-phosphoshikimate 1-carboxyvinyltransferase [unclassified Eikenella]OFK88268.1 3-phosphoshikimate 1-carboxyvinyltransferase [Eikenella sp. HMSC071B05]OFO48407.1 3-phosphoshikimate 1-carboxyvinyltransferase [Eikenella sp. HMSC073A11]